VEAKHGRKGPNVIKQQKYTDIGMPRGILEISIYIVRYRHVGTCYLDLLIHRYIYIGLGLKVVYCFKIRPLGYTYIYIYCLVYSCI
jgi:hypothetical protein